MMAGARAGFAGARRHEVASCEGRETRRDPRLSPDYFCLAHLCHPAAMTATSAREKVVERLVAWIWEQQALIGPLPADDGRAYQVVFRGRPWGERDPDFQGAILAREDGLLLQGRRRDPRPRLGLEAPRPRARPGLQPGDLPGGALAGRAAPDRPAGRHRDPDHRAGHPPGGAAGRAGASGRARSWRMQRRPGRHPGAALRPSPASRRPSDLALLLDRAGVARFLEHAATFESDLACLPPEEVLYRGALRAMGYTANTRGFEQLGQALPLATLRAVTAGPPGPARLQRLQAALLGVAGLLPEPARDRGTRGLARPAGGRLGRAGRRAACSRCRPAPGDPGASGRRTCRSDARPASAT